MRFRLGIDTGGTYTDAVLVDADDGIVAAAKCLTTRHDLTVGIGNALDELPHESLLEVGLVALSTTLSTNAVVEDRGAPVAVLLPGYDEQQLVRSGLRELFDNDFVVPLRGGHDATGRESEPLDEAGAEEAILRLRSKVSAFAISGMFGVRNPAHERRLRERVAELSDRPVTCGHELASSLDAPRRALTVALNARMVPIIHELIIAVRSILDRREIDAPLMMVKGNGSLVNTSTALQQPVGTVLSGPAASVVGACALSGLDNAIVADMGGTTTDIAVVAGGQPELGEDGVLVGDWKPMVEAVRVVSIGLGGDSEVRFSGRSGLEIGPRRVVPLSLVGHLHPATVQILEQQLRLGPSRRSNRLALPLESNDLLLASCDGEELRAWERVCAGPVELEHMVATDRPMARAIGRLQRKGLVIYSGFTPSDAAHVLGLCDHWCERSAQLAALLWARQMRHVYGLGNWQENDAESPSRHVFEQVSVRISRALIETGLHQFGSLDLADSKNLTGLLADLVARSGGASDQPRPGQSLFQLKFAADHPVVAVGAPAAAFFPQAAARLGVELNLPENAHVANAYGAVMGSVVQRAQLTVTQPTHGRFIVHSDDGPLEFSGRVDAMESARGLAEKKAMDLALAAGALDPEIRISSTDNHVEHDVDGELFLESRIVAQAIGRPDVRGQG